ncbi:T9SS type B sorting domain-containing protein [Flavobacterium sp. J27]|uniref:DUF7948 domain-containing protein n=1 Tax=Flavobacterium sp. J27 TaxID=2060419 RepID=UPI0010315586|nr:T9SS type B sorting domain-containing protein [Flavobacterium sp. J27]
MKQFYLFIFLVYSLHSFSQKQTSAIGFIENKGQIVDQKGKENSQVKYLLNTNGLNVQLRENGFSYDVYETERISLTKKDKEFNGSNSSFDRGIKNPDYSLKYNFHRIDIDFLNSNKNVALVSEDKSADYDNYYNVAHAPNGITQVHKYQKITYQNIYTNIDVVFFIPKDSTKVVEYNFIVKPGGKVSDIQLQFKGGKTELFDTKIRMYLRFGQMEETLPLSWIEDKNAKKEIALHYKKIKKNVFGFDGDVNHSNKMIVIDPVPIRLWGTYYGIGQFDNNGYSLTSDNYNNVYYCGSTRNNTNIATNGAYQTTLDGLFDGFIAKFDSNGLRLWGTYYGGSERDGVYLIDAKDNYFVIAGSTQSPSNIATNGTHSNTYNPGNGSSHQRNDCFIAKFNLDGTRIWGTYFGGEAKDDFLSISIDNNNNIILTGSTYSLIGIATSGIFKETRTQPVNFNTTGEGFIAKFNSNGNRLWASYYGLCEIRAVGTDSTGNIYFSGDISISPDPNENYISTPGTHQPIASYNMQTGVGFYDSFLVKFTPNGQRIWGTYFGGYRAEYNHGLKVDLEDNVYISGYTRSDELISTTNCHQYTKGGINDDADSYLAKFNPNGFVIWSTYYGGEELEHWGSYKIDVDLSNNVFLSGSTWSTNNISTANAYNVSNNGFADIFIVKFNSSGNRIWGTYFGGNGVDYNSSLCLDQNGGIYIHGTSNSANGIITNGSHQQFSNFSQPNFIAKFLDCQSNTVANSNSPICIGENLELTASGGTNYSWTGPNGFTSTEQNPIIPNATIANSGQYSCAITGSTTGCDDTITIDVRVGDSEAPIPTLQNLPTVTGDCNTIITIPTATDNCAGTITATTTDPLSYSNPGNYTITWLYDDGNGNTSLQTQNIVITSVSLPVADLAQQFCSQDNATIASILITGQNITWYNAASNGTVLPASTVLQDGVTYYATQTVNGCESETIPITVTIQNTVAPTGNNNQSFCSTANATLNEIVLAGTAITWYDSLNGNVILPNNTLLTDGTTYYATQTVNGCESTLRLAVTISLINTLNATDYSQSLCDDLNNGFEILNLTTYNSNLITSTGNTFSYYNSLSGAENEITSDEITNPTNYNLTVGNHVIYVRIDSPNTCHQVVELELTLYSKPFLAINDIMPICEGSYITIFAGNGYDNYQWSTGEMTPSITVFQPGNYSVNVSENHGTLVCSTTKNFTVVNSNIGTISQIISSDWTDNQNTISVLLQSNSDGNYEYSLDGITYQDSPIFTGLPNGEYTVYVNDKNGCGEVTETMYLLMYPKFFTPNGDGYNDYWKIKFSENEPHLRVQIFDRYGKFIKELGANSQGWDGTYLGNLLPSSDYWFTVKRQNGKVYKGHFTLKR